MVTKMAVCIFAAFALLLPFNEVSGQINCAIRRGCAPFQQPICAGNGVAQETFTNQCIFENSYCNFPTYRGYKKLHDGACPTARVPQAQNSPFQPSAPAQPSLYQPSNPSQPNIFQQSNSMPSNRPTLFQQNPQATPPATPNNIDMCSIKRQCSPEYNPVCGGDGTSQNTFTNACIFANSVCTVPSYKAFKKLSDGPCAKQASSSPTPSNQNTASSSPLPASDGQAKQASSPSFQSPNDVAKQKSSIFDIAPNQMESSVQKCNGAVRCSDQWNPVCAGDGKSQETFRNGCLLMNAQCEAPKYQDYKKLHDGECAVTPSPKGGDINCSFSRRCSTDREFVCGGNGATMESFTNQCIFENSVCTDARYKGYSKMHDGGCKHQPSNDMVNCDVRASCRPDDAPICAGDGKTEETFQHECMFRGYVCAYQELRAFKKLHDGPCGEQPASAAPHLPSSQTEQPGKTINCDIRRQCSGDYKPVCSGDGASMETFHNACIFENSVCMNPKHKAFKKLHDGPCKEEPKAPQHQSHPAGQAGQAERTINCDIRRQCSSTYKPVCSGDGKSMETFHNACYFENSVCVYPQHKGYKKLHDGQCEEKPKAPQQPASQPEQRCNGAIRCAGDYIPICAGDGLNKKTFNNACMFQNALCEAPQYKSFQKLHDGECPEDANQQAGKPVNCDISRQCSVNYKPVCGGNGATMETFHNECIFENSVCMDPNHKGYTKMHDGDCRIHRPDSTHPQKDIILCGHLNPPCKDTLEPLCAGDEYDQESFPNACVLKEYACGYDFFRGFKKLHDGLCEEQHANETPQPPQPESAGQPDRRCDGAIRCASDYLPICTGDGVNKKTFNNACMFQNALCEAPQYKSYQKLHDGECPEEASQPAGKPVNCLMSRQCSRDYKPVCAGNGATMETFHNECIFENSACTNAKHKGYIKMHEGDCRIHRADSVHPQKDIVLCGHQNPPCPDTLAPICAGNEQEQESFPNECLYKEYACEYDFVRNYKKLHDGMCGEKPAADAPQESQPQSAGQPAPKCDGARRCASEYKPICAGDGVSEKTFTNACMFQNALCEAPQYQAFQKLHDGECAETANEPAGKTVNCAISRSCSRDYEPVCGSNGATMESFQNECIFENSVCMDPMHKGYTKMHDGECRIYSPNDTDPRKDIVLCGHLKPQCPAEEAPICAGDDISMETFTNSCEFEEYACALSFVRGFKKIHDGVCAA